MNKIQTEQVREVINSSSSFEEKKSHVKEILKYGNVPLIYRGTKVTLKSPAEPGLANLIKNAMSKQEVDNLLIKGKMDYKNANSGTIKKWQKIASKRIEELTK